MFRCIECGYLFENGEQNRSLSCIGECHGRSVSEEISSCPLCGGDYEEATKCKICGSYEKYAEDAFCPDCVAGTIKNFKHMLINFFTTEEIELLEELNEEGSLWKN